MAFTTPNPDRLEAGVKLLGKWAVTPRGRVLLAVAAVAAAMQVGTRQGGWVRGDAGPDFNAYWAAARAWRLGEPVPFGAELVGWAEGRQVAAGWVYPTWPLPPLRVLFGGMDHSTAWVLWWSMMFAAVLAALFAWNLASERPVWTLVATPLATAVFAGSVEDALGQGQVSPVLGLGIAVFALALGRAPVLAGVALAIAAAIKLWPAGLVAACLNREHRQGAAWALGLGAGLILMDGVLVADPWTRMMTGIQASSADHRISVASELAGLIGVWSTPMWLLLAGVVAWLMATVHRSAPPVAVKAAVVATSLMVLLPSAALYTWASATGAVALLWGRHPLAAVPAVVMVATGTLHAPVVLVSTLLCVAALETWWPLEPARVL